MTPKVSLLFFNLDASIPLVRDLWSYFKEDKDFDLLGMKTAEELNQYLLIAHNGILFFKIDNKEDLQEAINVLKNHRKYIKRGLLKPVSISSIYNKKIKSLLAKYGCVDNLDPILKAKTVAYKIDMWKGPIIKSLADIENKNKLRKKAKEAESAKKAALKEAKKAQQDFIFVPPLETKNDFWILKDKKTDATRNSKEYTLRLLGPSPAVGEWIELNKQAEEEFVTWKWQEHQKPVKSFYKNEGAWFFTGKKPEYDWESRRWSFLGEEIHLFFFVKGWAHQSRVKYESNQVRISENSQEAFNLEHSLLETWHPKHNPNNQSKEPFVESEVSDEEVEEINRQMQGNSKSKSLKNDEAFDGSLPEESLPKAPDADPFAGFDPEFNSFNLPKRNDADEAFATNPQDFQDPDQKRPKKYMDLADYMDLDEDDDDGLLKEVMANARENKTQADVDPYEETEEIIEEEDSYANGWKGKKVRKEVREKASSSSSSFGSSTQEEREQEMLEALGGDLTKRPTANKAEPIVNDIIHNLGDKNKKIGRALEPIEGEKPSGFIGSLQKEPEVDLESGQLKVTLKQKTDAGNEITFICGFEDFYEDELIVKAPKNSLPLNSKVFAHVILEYKGHKVKVISMGKITEIEDLSENEDTLIISLVRVDNEKYKKFMKLYQERQESIHEFMQMAKGY